MKKRILSILLTLALSLSMAPAAFALGSFADVTDAATAQNVEVLRLMGVIEGNGAGAFLPGNSLTRAEFCKMAVELSGKRGAVARYGTRTVFPDVRATHWAAGYVNFAASKEAGLIHGMPDGSFAPDRAITYGEAVAILTRMLGYTDADTGGIWPDGYLRLAGETGLTASLSIGGYDAITRAQAAKLFVNALTSKNEKGETTASKLGYALEDKETVLYSVDVTKGKLHTENGDYELAAPMSSTLLNGLKGRVLCNAEGKAVTFLPSVSSVSGDIPDGAIIVAANGSAAGFSALTGSSADYGLLRNGIPATVSDIRANDVAVYNAASNTILLCDTRVSVYYEGCSPSPEAPNTITVLGGTKFTVLTTARESLAQFRPGQNITLLLAADGRVAGALEGSDLGNAFAYVSGAGKVSLICGGSLLPLETKRSDRLSMSTEDVLGDVVRIMQKGNSTGSTIWLYGQRGSEGDFDPVKRTIGTRKVISNALIFNGDSLTSLAALGTAIIPEGRIAYARKHGADSVDLIVIKDNAGEYYGRATVRSDGSQRISIDLGPNEAAVEQESHYVIRTGDFVSFRYNSNGEFINVAPLEKLLSVPASAWIGDSAVNYRGKTYIVSDKVLCYNRDSSAWFDDVAAMKAFGGKLDLYVKNGVVHAIELHA